MSDLVVTLKKQHVMVLEIVGRINQALAAHNFAAITSELEKFKTGLLAHLKLEDAQLYPAMLQMAKQSGRKSLAEIAETFQSNMQSTSKTLVAFLTRYQTVDAQKVATFKSEWNNILTVLGARIKAEENSLYVQFERAQKELRPGATA